MKLLLDTHTLVWWAFDSKRLSITARAAIADSDNDVFASAITAMEIATKVRLGKFEEARPLATRFFEQVQSKGFRVLAVTADHGERAGNLPIDHKDPWDRLLIAQAQIEQLTLVSNEEVFDNFGVVRLW